MKIRELLENMQIMPHLYLDMDGVQADFFGAWAAKHNVGNYKEIPDTETSINELASSSPLEVYKFFRELQPLEGGGRVVQWLNQHNILHLQDTKLDMHHLERMNLLPFQ